VLATADDLASAMSAVVERIRRSLRAARVEWWVTGEDGALELAAAAGTALGSGHELPLGVAGAFVLYADGVAPQVESALISLSPLIRRRGRRAPGPNRGRPRPAQRGALELRGVCGKSRCRSSRRL
jgi:hypothetical protein